VQGLTRASIVWLTAAIGMAAGAGLPILAIAVTCVHFIVVFIFPAIERNLPKSRWAPSSLQISYEARRGALKEILAVCTGQELSVSRVQIEGNPLRGRGQSSATQARVAAQDGRIIPGQSTRPKLGDLSVEEVVTLRVEVPDARPVSRLAARLNEIAGVIGMRVEMAITHRTNRLATNAEGPGLISHRAILLSGWLGWKSTSGRPRHPRRNPRCPFYAGRIRASPLRQ
jgi:putative Mg2+ transporter-C (MgtC) family protein